ncbi:MAG TPA: class I SAM-dependent methyltransferase [Gammaproteobacteria bacterium]|nr:class I SAM-dependent methyltransferase [Gammaproteobacteria bacterium]
MDASGRPSTQPALLRLFTDSDFRRRAVRYLLRRPAPLPSEDRRVLEQVIFKFYESLPDITNVLFVGVSWYTRHYERCFFPGRTFWTVDISPSARKHGARRHVTAPVQDLAAHFSPGQFDLVLLNGVYGHGLNEKEDCERGFGACYDVLREGGHFLLGWNDVAAHRGAPLGALASLARFKPFVCPVLGVEAYLTDTPSRHIFQFYTKPESGRSP